MKKFAADNLMFLRDQYPEIYKLMRNRLEWPPRLSYEPARNGQANLLVRQPKGDSFYLYSRYDPSREAELWVQSLERNVADADEVLMVGLGLGYHLKTFLQAFPEKRVYLYEPEPDLLFAALETVDLRSILGHRQIAMFAVGADELILSEMLMAMFRSLKGRFSSVIVPPYRKLLPDLERRLADIVRERSINYRVDLNTRVRHQADWIENLTVNLERTLRTPSFYPLKDVCRGWPAIVAGSGPSLGEEIEYLRLLKNHAFIIAAGTAVKGLLHHGIEPHLIVSMDPGEPNFWVFKDLEVGQIPFLYITTIKHKVIRDDRAPYLMHGYLDVDVISRYILELTPEDGVLMSTGTVSGTAVQMAAFLGCSEIVLIGQDFSYPGDRVYLDGAKITSEKHAKRLIDNALLTVENVSGGKNKTNEALLHLKLDLELIIQKLVRVPVYNASRIGAVIRHTQLKMLEQLYNETKGRKLDPDWFKVQMRARLSPYPPERRAKAARKAAKTLEELNFIQDRLNQLHDLFQTPINRYADWLVAFEPLWGSIVTHPLFEQMLAFFLAKELDYVQRHWDEVLSEADLRRKYEKLLTCVKPVLEGLSRVVPLLMQHLRILTDKLGAKG